MRRQTSFLILLMLVIVLVSAILPVSAISKLKETYIVAYNTTSGAWEVLDKGDLLRPTIDATLTIKYDAAAYTTITQANAAGVTFNCTSDGTAIFNFSDPVSITGNLTNVGVLRSGFDAAAYWTATTADGAGVSFDATSDGTAAFTFLDPVTTVGVLTNMYDTLAYWTATQANAGAVTFDSVSDGTAGFLFSDPVTFGSVVSVGLLGGAGTSASHQSIGAGGDGVKAWSYYLSSTSTTASNSQTGLYLNMDYGTVGTSAAPSGDAIRGRAYLNGDASGAVALTGGAFTVEHGAGASNAGLETGLRGNIVLADEALAAGGTYYGAMAEIYTGGASSSMAAVTDAALLGLSLSGTAPTAAAQLSNVSVFSITLPANEVGNDLIVDDTASDGTVGAKMRIKINGTYYWIMLADAAN